MGNSTSSPGNRLVLPTTLLIRDFTFPVASLIDSGAEQNLISSELLEHLNIPVVALYHPVTVSDLAGKTMTTITHNTAPVVSGNYCEKGEFFVFSSPTSHVILGYPWLRKHNPTINSTEKRVESLLVIMISPQSSVNRRPSPCLHTDLMIALLISFLVPPYHPVVWPRKRDHEKVH